MNTQKKTPRRIGAAPVLTGVASAAALLLLSGGAQAASFSVFLPFGTPTASAQLVAGGYNANFTSVMAQAFNNGASISQVGSGTNTTLGNTNNTIGALAAGNRSAQSISTLAAAPNGVGQGALAYSVAQNQGTITSLAVLNTISNTQGSLMGSSTVQGNQIYADTTVNEGSSVISGALPNGFGVAVAGQATHTGIGGTQVQGGLVAVTTQSSIEAASSSATANSNAIGLTLGQLPSGSATLDQNQVSATFRGNDTENSVAIAAAGAPTLSGSVVASNTQARSGANAFADATNNTVIGNVGALIGGSMRGSLSVQQNTVGSEASGNTASNTIGLDESVSVGATGSVPGVDPTGARGGLVVASSQSNVGAAALRSDTSVTRVLGQVGSVGDSTVEVSRNTVASQAVGNRVTNGISNVGAGAGVGTAGVAGSAMIGNLQLNQIGTLPAGANGDIWARTDNTQIAVTSNAVLLGNTLSASANAISAQAAASEASNTVDLQGATLALDASGSGVSAQAVLGTTTAGVGVLNTQRNLSTEVRAENGNALISVSGQSAMNSTWHANGNALSSVASGNGSDNTVRLRGVDVDAGTALLNQQTNDSSRIQATLGADTLPYTVNVASTGGMVSGAQLAVNGNEGLAAATANAANNQLSVSGTPLAANAGNASVNTLSGTAVTADHVLSNDQMVSRTTGVPSGQRAYANGAFTLQGSAPATLATTAALSVSGNEQDARAIGNTATNALSLTGVTLDSRSALASTQISAGSVTADSLMAVSSATSMLINSSVTLDANRNTAMAITNRAANTLQVQGTTVGALVGGTAAVDAFQASAGHVLSNLQVGTGEQAYSNASTTLNNLSPVAATVTGSTMKAADNVTWAESVVNFASNTLDVSGAAELRSAAVLQNTQNSLLASGAGVVANSQTNMSGSWPTFNLASAINSSAALNDNSTVALAYGNSAANALNATAGASYAQGFAPALNTVSPNAVTGVQYALLNNQANGSNVAANSAAIYEIGALNNASGSNNTLNVAGNAVAAVAYGNSSTNAMQLAALNSAMPTAAVSSSQQNTGVITAMAASSSAGVLGGSSVGSSLAVRGNQITATAVGNSSTSTIQAAR